MIYRSNTWDVGGGAAGDCGVGCVIRNVTGGLKIYLAVGPADIRKGFGGLYALASEKMKTRAKKYCFFTTGAIFVVDSLLYSRAL